MNFINPLVLFGLLAASIPVLLHLLNLRKLKTVEFSSLKFLKELQKTKIRKLKLKQIILLILRTLIVIFAVLAFARPTIPGSIPFFESYSKTSAVILIDNSFSMDISDEFGNRFNRMKSQALNIISTLGDGDEVALVNLSEDGFSTSNFTRNFEYADQQLRGTKISLSPANLNRGLRITESLLKDASNINKEIYVLSDAQNNVFDILNNDSVRIKSSVALAALFSIGNTSKADLQNISVDSVKIISRIFQREKVVEVEAYIRNGSKNPINDVVVNLSFDGKSVAQRSSDIGAGETKSFLISAAPNKTGPIKACIEVESDIQEYDNKRFFGFNIPPKPRILVATENDNLFIKSALRSLEDTDKPGNLIFRSISQISSEDFNAYDAVILVDGGVSKNDYNRLSQYILEGGSVLAFADDKEQVNLADFLRSNGVGEIKQSKFSNIEPAAFGNIDREHPIFEGVFDEKASKNLPIETPKIFKALPSVSARSLISIPGGAFLSEAAKGEGKMLYIAVSPNTDWSNFPLTGIFPAIVYRSVLYLTSSEDLSTNIIVGQSLIYKVPAKFSYTSDFKIIDPNDNEFFTKAVDLPQGKVISFEKLSIPGIYTIYDDNGKYVSQIAVNSDVRESHLESIDNDKLEKLLASRIENCPIIVMNDNQEIKNGINRARTGTELWQIFILLAILTAVAEMIVQRVTKNEIGEA